MKLLKGFKIKMKVEYNNDKLKCSHFYIHYNHKDEQLSRFQ